MENNEFLIDHRAGNEASATAESINSRGNLMDDEDFGGDHSQLLFKPSSGGANNNLLLEATGTAADGTFVLDGDDEEQEARRSAGSDDEEADDKHELLLSSLPPQPQQQQHYGTDDDISKSSLSSPLNEYSQAAAETKVVEEEVKPPTSSSIDDFEFIATPQRAEINATAEPTTMDNSNLLDFESSPPAPANLVETLLTTGEDLKAHKDSAAAYLENEFTQFKSGSQQAAQDFMNLTSTQTKPVKDVYNDFMEAERGHHHDVIQPVKKEREPSPVRPEEVMDEKPIETISSTPIVPIEMPATTTITHPAVEAEKKSDVEPIKPSAQFEAANSDDEDDLHEQFSDTPPALPERHFQPEPEQKKPIVEKEEVVVGEEKKKVNVMDGEPQQQAPAPALPVFVKEEAKTKPVEVIKPTVTPVVAAPATNKPVKDELITTSAEEMFCKFGLDAWFKPERLHPKVESLIYWRDVKKSGIVCGAGMVILLAMSCFSVISVFAYVSLTALFGTVAFRIYKSVMQAVQKTSDGHPFKAFMDFELQLPQEKVQQVTGVAVSHINSVLAELRRLFLVEDLVDSIKFGLMLWCLTYVGAWFNGMTLVILAYIALFTLPKVYETNKQSIDAYLDLVRSKINEITEKVKAAIPIGKKAESDKEK